MGTYNDPTKKRGPPKGYIEAIEARLHRMEGLLGGLVKDKDPRAEIVKAELDAMAREAEMTGLKLRRSKAYEEMTHAMGISLSLNAAESTSIPTVKKEPSASDADQQLHKRLSSPELVPSSQQQQQPYSYRPQQPPQPQQQQQQTKNPSHHHSGHYTSRQHHRPTGSSPVNSAYSSSIDGHGSSAHIYSIASIPPHPYQRHRPHQQPVSHFSSKNGQSLHDNHQYSSHEHWQQYQHHHHLHSNPNYESSIAPHHYHSSSSETYPSSWAGNERNGSGSKLSPRNGSDPDYRSLNPEHPPHIDPLTGYMTMPRQVISQERMLVLPSPEVMEHLFDIHFRFVHPVLPMIHRKSFYEQFRGPDPPSPHLLFAVLGLASRFSDNPAFRTPQPGADRPPCTIFYERAKELIKEEYDNSQVGTVQALLLMAIQQMGFCESQRAWLHVGMAIRMAQDLGLNIDPSEQEQIRNPVLAEQRRRTWWSCYVVERLVCAGLGRPLSITQEDCETSFPRYDEPESLSTDAALVGCAGISSNFVLLITLSSIQGNILQFIKARAVRNDDCRHLHEGSPLHPTLSNSSDQDRSNRVDTSPAAFAALDRSLTEWRQKLPAALQNPTSDSPHYGLFLHMTYNTLIILLHRPEIFYSPTSASLCTEAAATITEITEILVQAKALTSMVISCLYAIFSAGIIHFINIPSVKRNIGSNYSSPTLASTRPVASAFTPAPSTAAQSAKANMKRCINALKFLSSHWVSAARRAKVLEDLLDLKKVCLRDLEVDSFQTMPLMPDWAVETTKFGQALSVPREGHDQLRQKCRSKMMAIQSILANDEEYDQMHNRRSSIVDEHMESAEDRESMSAKLETTVDYHNKSRNGYREDHVQSFSGPSERSSTSPNHSLISPPQKHPYSFGSDPMMLISTATFGSSDVHPAASESSAMDVEARRESRAFTPMTLTTLGYNSSATSPATFSSSRFTRHGSISATSVKQLTTSTNSVSKASMLDPFSMPSSITFPESHHGRHPSYGSGVDPLEGLGGGGSQHTHTARMTDAQVHRTTAQTEERGDSPSSSGFRRDGQEDRGKIPNTLQKMLVAEAASPSQSSGCGDDQDQDDHDVVWSDMPPTLGLDEWMAYIGALMMRWLASGESSPHSPLST
ncbi:hypothetical protein FBU30_004981 [Linnemannia zychae]|nr:hypothetical protein FBU30_004981 [Linnemannia zychae]